MTLGISDDIRIESLLREIEVNELKASKTLLITDYRCIEHADFPQKRNIKEKAFQRQSQPENSDRLSLLVDEQTGIFTKGIEF